MPTACARGRVMFCSRLRSSKLRAFNPVVESPTHSQIRPRRRALACPGGSPAVAGVWRATNGCKNRNAQKARAESSKTSTATPAAKEAPKLDDKNKPQSDATNATRKYMPDLNAVRRVVNEAQSAGLVNASRARRTRANTIRSIDKRRAETPR